MPDQAAPLKFSNEHYTDVREGYLTLEWNEHDSAAVYSVTDERSVEVFRGIFPQAFVSGLADGEHSFSVAALDGRGEVIAQSTTPASVTVEHWPLGLALSLFGCGLVVLVTVIGVLVWGSFSVAARSESVS